MMSKHKTLSIIGAASIALGLLGAGCSSAPADTNAKIAPVANTPAAATTTRPTKTFSITAKQFAFEPSTIEVNEGDEVVLTISSVDVTHGFSLADFGVSEALAPGKTTTVKFVADKKGVFSFVCSVFCGAGHAEMKGTLTVR